jgi:hypothetical protein
VGEGPGDGVGVRVGRRVGIGRVGVGSDGVLATKGVGVSVGVPTTVGVQVGGSSQVGVGVGRITMAVGGTAAKGKGKPGTKYAA